MAPPDVGCYMHNLVHTAAAAGTRIIFGRLSPLTEERGPERLVLLTHPPAPAGRHAGKSARRFQRGPEAGYWMLDSRCWMLVGHTGVFSFQYSVFSVQSDESDKSDRSDQVRQNHV